MSYLGNPSLSQDVQDRITGTFEQTLELVTQGKYQEAQVGCDFILRLDPIFRPAQQLLERLKSGQRPVAIDDLRAPAAAPGDEAPLQVDSAPADVPPPMAPGPEAAAPAAQPPSGSEKAETDDDDLLELQRMSLALDDGLEDPFAAEGEAVPELGGDLPGLEALDEIPGVDDLAPAPPTDALEEIPGLEELAPAPAATAELPGFEALEEVPPPPGDELAAFEAPEEVPPPPGDELAAFEAPADVPAPPGDELAAFEAPAEVPAPPGDELAAFEAPAEVPAPPGDELAAFEAPEELSAEEVAPEIAPTAADELSALGTEEAGPALAEALPEAGDEGPQVDLLTLEDEAEAPAAEAEGAGDRISGLLEEGQQAFDRDDFQGAIDVWSRIFLMDIDNAEATRRIEEARAKKAELERQAEEIFHEGVGQIEAKAFADAQESFRRVLEINPNHTLAREYLEQLEAGQVPTVIARGVEAEEVTDEEELAATSLAATQETGQTLDAAIQRDRMVVVKKVDRRLIALGAVVPVLVVALVVFLVMKWDDLFPNTDTPAAAAGPRRLDPITRATGIHEAGKVENAIALLERIPADDPSYEEAQALLAQWRAEVEAPVEEDAGPSEEMMARRNLLLDAARTSYRQLRCIRARRYFDQAGKITPLSTEDLALKRQCDAKLESLATELRKYQDGEYAQILPTLWRRREENPDDHDVTLLIVNSYYNLALTDLQRGDPLGAAEKLTEALEVDSSNRDLERLRLFAQTYTDRQPDLLYRIFVKYVPPR